MSTNAQKDDRQKLVELASLLMAEAKNVTKGMTEQQRLENVDFHLLLGVAGACKKAFEANGTLDDVVGVVLAVASTTMAHIVTLQEECSCPRCRARALAVFMSAFAASLGGCLGVKATVAHEEVVRKDAHSAGQVLQ